MQPVHCYIIIPFQILLKILVVEPGLLSYRNIEKAYFTGLEIISKWAINSRISSSFTFNYVRNEDENNEQIPNTIPLSIGGDYHIILKIKKIIICIQF